jgi:hypothetical protein
VQKLATRARRFEEEGTEGEEDTEKIIYHRGTEDTEVKRRRI